MPHEAGCAGALGADGQLVEPHPTRPYLGVEGELHVPRPLPYLVTRPAPHGVDDAFVASLEGGVTGKADLALAGISPEVVITQRDGHDTRLGVVSGVGNGVQRSDGADLEVDARDGQLLTEVKRQRHVLARGPRDGGVAGHHAVEECLDEARGHGVAGQLRCLSRGRRRRQRLHLPEPPRDSVARRFDLGPLGRLRGAPHRLESRASHGTALALVAFSRLAGDGEAGSSRLNPSLEAHIDNLTVRLEGAGTDACPLRRCGYQGQFVLAPNAAAHESGHVAHRPDFKLPLALGRRGVDEVAKGPHTAHAPVEALGLAEQCRDCRPFELLPALKRQPHGIRVADPHLTVTRAGQHSVRL